MTIYPTPEQIAEREAAERMKKWDRRFINMARHIAAEWSKDPSTKVGAVLVDVDKVVIGTGFNGFPRGVDDDPERYADREMKLDLTVHAEMNAILKASASARGSTLYCTHPPCVRCAAHIIQAGSKRVVSVAWDRPDWAKSIERSQMIFREARVVFDMIEGM